MSGVTVAIMVICGIAIFMWALYVPHMQNRFFVEPAKRERLVLINRYTGKMKVRGAGTWYEWLHWRELARVDTNREPVHVQNETVKTSDGALFLAEYRFDMLAGRPYATEDGIHDGTLRKKGQLLVDDPDDENHVEDTIIMQAVTRIDFFEDREDRMKQYAARAMEHVVGRYSSAELMEPQTTTPESPKGSGRHVSDVDALYTAMSKEAQDEQNAELTFVGINAEGFAIMNLVPKDPELQRAFEQKLRTERKAAAALKAMELERQTASATPLTTREALVIGEESYADVTWAESWRDAGKSIGEGLRNFGRGNQN